MRAGLTPDESEHTFVGGAGVDSVTYASADRFVTVSLDSQPNDGRPGDRDNVAFDVEHVTGSPFPDRITGSDAANQIVAAFGPDTVQGLAGNDTFLEDARANGADSIAGGTGRDEVFYSQRTGAVVIDTDGVADDGQAGELDNVRSDVEVILTGAGNDTVIGAAAANAFTTGAGDDVVDGKGGADELFPGAGEDTALGGAGNDTIDADADGASDVVRCGAGVDVAFIDEGVDVAIGCETLR
jgi:Ca2+-binding RTX toxin-like protein